MKRLIAALLAVTLFGTLAYGAAQKTIPLDFDGTTADTTSVGTADSTGIIGTGQYERLYLWIKPNKPCKIAVQVRAHGITDFPTPSTLPDSTQTALWLWRGFNTLAGDTLSLALGTAPTAIQAGSSELTVYFPEPAAGKWGAPRGIYIPLRSVTGEWYWARNTSIRVRVLTAYGANAVITWSAALSGVSF